MAGLLAIIAALPVLSNRMIIPFTFFHDVPKVSRELSFYQIPSGLLYINLLQGTGLVGWNSSIRIPTVVQPKGQYFKVSGWRPNPRYQGEVWLDGNQGSASLRSIRTNNIEVMVSPKQSATLVINQNYDPGWTSNTGKVINHQELLAVVLETPGLQEVRLTYRPRGLLAAATVSLIAILWIIFVCVIREKQRRHAGKPIE